MQDMCTCVRGMQLRVDNMIEKRATTSTGNSKVCLQPQSYHRNKLTVNRQALRLKTRLFLSGRIRKRPYPFYMLTLLALDLGGGLSTIFLVVSAPDKSMLVAVFFCFNSSSCGELPPNDVTGRSRARIRSVNG